MHNHTYGEIFEREAPRATRPSRSAARCRPSYNEDLMTPRIGDEGDGGVAHASIFPCTDFLRDAGILDDFLFLVNKVGLMEFMQDESEQYARLTKIFVESFSFNNTHFSPSVAFKIYDRPYTMDLKDFAES